MKKEAESEDGRADHDDGEQQTKQLLTHSVLRCCLGQRNAIHSQMDRLGEAGLRAARLGKARQAGCDAARLGMAWQRTAGMERPAFQMTKRRP